MQHNRIAFEILLELFLGAIGAADRIGHGVTHEAIGADFEQCRNAFLACALDRIGGGDANGDHVLSVHDVARHVIRRAALVNVVDGGRTLDGGAHAVAVVLDDEQAWQLPERRHVERFVEGAVVDRCLAHEAHDDLIATAILDRETDTGRDRNVSADDAMSTQKAERFVEHMHRAALALGAAVLSSE